MLEKMIPTDWKILLKSEFEKPYFKKISANNVKKQGEKLNAKTLKVGL